jgi:uncharacterized protein YjiK
VTAVKPVSLQSVVEELVALNDDSTAYINRKTGELVTFSEEEARIVEEGNDWYSFRDTDLKRIAADFLDLEGIAWQDEEIR